MFYVARADISQFPYYFSFKFETLQGKEFHIIRFIFQLKSQYHLLIIQKINFI